MPAPQTVVDSDHDADLGDELQARTVRRRRRNVVLGSLVLCSAMALVVLDGVGVLDLVGVDDAVVTAEHDGTSLTVRHPAVTRPGLASPLEITVERAGGFPGGTVDVAVSAGYLLAWDLNGIVPAPSAERADRERVVWTFEVPDGEVLTVRYEARIEPARQHGASGRFAVLDEDGAEVVAVDVRTAIRP